MADSPLAATGVASAFLEPPLGPDGLFAVPAKAQSLHRPITSGVTIASIKPARAERCCPPLPRQVVLVGTQAAITSLAASLAVTSPSLQILGCFTPNGVHPDQPLAILGSLDDLRKNPSLAPRGAAVLLAFPTALRSLAADLARLLPGARWLPPLEEQLAGRATWSASAVAAKSSLDPSWLLDRDPHPLDRRAIGRIIRGKIVLITGAGGSIGSELARLVAGFEPAKLVLVERGENPLFEIDREIAATFPAVARAAVLHDITNGPATRWLLAEHRPHVVFHAAAHKHVPMMEDHPAHAVENNFYGTRSIADAAQAAGAQRFVMISTDKAVNPCSVMGATKRLAELYIQYLAARCRTLFCMVRFGNVLGSACSVLPIWSQQIAAGGPVTVTHPDMTRYFMTIPEAAGLVLQSAALTKGGEVFLLDMGAPIRIVDLAQRFIRAHGLEPGREIAIQFTGIRPGEKLFEELAYEGEDMLPTPHKSIRIWRTKAPSQRRMKAILARFDALRSGAGTSPGAQGQAILRALHASIPEMRSPALPGAAGARHETGNGELKTPLPRPLAAAG